jgi:serine/threonine-protein kinase RIO1
MKSKTTQRILSETSPETVKKVRNNYVINFLEINGFTMKEENVYSNTSCTVIIFDSYYSVDYYDEDFNSELSCYTDNLSIPSLAGLLSYMDFIPRGYNK